MTGQALSKQRNKVIFSRLERAAPAIRKQFGVRKIGIFGSYARGEQTGTSDVDVLIELAEGYATLRNFVRLADHLEALFGRKVDLITTEGLDKYIRPHIEKEVIWIEG